MPLGAGLRDKRNRERVESVGLVCHDRRGANHLDEQARAAEVREEAKDKDLQFVIDATCPLVQKVHREVRRFAENGYWIILIGHADHDEIVGTSGEAPAQIQVVEPSSWTTWTSPGSTGAITTSPGASA